MKPSILVIEDEPTLARLLSYNLNREGYDVTVAENGGDGLRLAVTQAFDLIILDIMLPGLNGFEVLSRMRERGVQKPVIILTARSAEDEIVRGLRMGADDYMTKPFGVDELLARVSAVLRRSGGRGRRTAVHPGTKRKSKSAIWSFTRKNMKSGQKGSRLPSARRNSRCCSTSSSGPASSSPVTT